MPASFLLKFNIAHIIFLIFLNLVWGYAGGFSFAWETALQTLLICLALVGFGFFYTKYRPDEYIAAMFNWTAVLIAYSAMAATLSYLSVSLNFPLWDEELQAIDLALGFDWQAMLSFVATRPYLWFLWNFFYQISLPLIAFTVIFLALTKRVYRLEEFMTSLTLAATLTVLSGGVVAALGPYAYFPEFVSMTGDYLPTVLASDYVTTLNGLRDGTLVSLSLEETKGLITIPSFHAVMAVLMIVALRGIKIFFWLAFCVNGMTLLVTPIDGGHYVIDLLVGLVVALVIWKIVNVFMSGHRRMANFTPRPCPQI